MAAEPTSSSWHPAVMPNNAAAAAAATEASADATRSTSSPNDLPIQPEKPSALERPSNGIEELSNGEGVANAWLSQDDEGGDDAWLASEEPASEHLPTEPAAEIPEPVAAANPKTSTSQHASSMSFARTVSHDLTFGDDDEGDWNLSRTDTDPFKFMPPSDRTNSFPVVPPMSPNSGSREQQPLPSNQAADVLEENDKDVDAEEEEYQRGNAPEHSDELNAPKRQHARSISIGGDLPGPDRRDSEARYEEGVPLISPHGQEQLLDNSNTAAVSSFDDDTTNGDDFFSQVQSSQTDSSLNGLSAKPLERKSTMQVLNSVNPSSLSRQSTLDEEDEVLNQTGKDVRSEGQPQDAPSSKDLTAKWEAAFEDDDDDDFLLEDSTPPENKEVDPAAFFGSDDEGFLEDDEPAPAPQPASTAQNPYLPEKPLTQRAASYTPAATAPVQATPGGMYGAPTPAITPYGSASQYNTPAPTERPGLPRAQSFVEKSKGGYSSPYDLPTDLVKPLMKPRKRASLQQLPQSSAPPPQGPPLPRSTSMFMPGPPSNSLSPPTSSHGSQGAPVHQGPPVQHKPPTPGVQHKENFFEELPMVSKPRPSSRTSIRAPSPAQHPPPMAYGAHAAPPMPSAMNQMPPPPLPAHAVASSLPPAPQPTGVGNLVAPERVSPYAALSTTATHLPPPSAPNGSRYSPAPGAAGSHSAPPAPANSRYSPAPPAAKGHASYGPVAASAVPPPILPFQPRTSSPLTHCETNHGPNGDLSLAERRMSSYESRLNRMSSLPPTREVDEEDDQTTPIRSLSATHPPLSHYESRYSPGNSPKTTRRTPPPPSYAGQLTLSPPKQSGPGYVPYAPHAPPTAQAGFVPPPRAQTQSPSAAYGHKQGTRSSDHTRRPSSAHSATSPVMTRPTNLPYAPTTRVRGQSITMNLVAPTDGREKDPLQRWKGCPIFTWGVGGTIVTSFPNSVPRYGIKQSVPTIIRTLGEVKVRNVKDIEPLQERLAKFPGPLKGKSKKKETIAWLTAGIESLEKDVPDISFPSQLSLESKRTIERLILWRILRIFIEYDGILEGTPAVEKAVRDVLSPGTITPTADDDALFPRIGGLGVESTSVTAMPADGADISTMDQIRHHLLRGDREKAVWALVDKRLWGHAMLISHTVSGDLYKQVAQEFVRKEVNYPGHNNESMAALYKILSGNFDDCVDELVPVHARAGLQLMSTQSGPGPAKATLDGLDKWRETLCLVLSNRSVDDIRGLNALGNLLSSYGRAEAAHICFLFGRNASHFGGLDDPSANIVLLGADHHQQSDQFAKETEALQLSEVYEYGLSLAGGVAAAAGVPHLAAYKLQLAMTLAEYGYRDKALQYCDAIETAMTSQTKRSPYHHAILEAAVNDFMIRLKQAPKDETNSWISKPSMNKVSDSMWNRFNKFVAGEENENNGAGPGGESESGPFGRIATTPTMSRSPSVSNFEVYGGQSPGYPMGVPPPAATAAGSRYAPATVTATPSSNPYDPSSQVTAAPRSSIDRGSNEFTRSSYEPTHQGSSGGYIPMAPSLSESNIHQSDSGMVGAPGLAPAPQITQGTQFGGYQPFGVPTSASMPALPMSGEDKVADSSQQGYQPLSYGYEPPSLTPDAPTPEAEVVTAESGSGGYEAPSFQPYGYEPPSYQPDLEPTADDEDDAPKPKKKSFMDDDDDDIPALKPKTQSKSEKDRENEEMFRKAAEEDAKRAAGQQSPKKGWGFSGWFGGSKKPETPAAGDQSPGKPIRAKLGEASSFVYDPDLKRWVNKKPGAENVPAKTATPPPPRTIPRSVSGTPPPMSTGTPPPPMASSAPSGGMPLHMRSATPELTRAPSMDNLGLSAPPLMNRSVSNPSLGGSSMPSTGSRPSTAMSNASSIDDLIGAAAPRKPGEKKKPRKSGRYIDVMAK